MSEYYPYASSEYADGIHLYKSRMQHHDTPAIQVEQQDNRFHPALQIVENIIPGVLGEILTFPQCIPYLKLILDGISQGQIDQQYLASVFCSNKTKEDVRHSEITPTSSHLNRNLSVLSKNSWVSTLSGETMVPMRWNPADQQQNVEDIQTNECFLDNSAHHLGPDQHDTLSQASFYSHATYQKDASHMQPSLHISTPLVPQTPGLISMTSPMTISKDQLVFPDDGSIAEHEASLSLGSPSFPAEFQTQQFNLDPIQQTQYHHSISSLPHEHVLLNATNENMPQIILSERSKSALGTEKRQQCVEFIHEVPNQQKVRQEGSYCPQCNIKRTSRIEFVKHVQAEHDRPIEYVCKHFYRVDTALCDFRTWSASTFSRHHTEKHKDCETSKQEKLDTSAELPCLEKRFNPRPKRVWGCSYCEWVTSSGVDIWAKHHLEKHKGRQRKEVSTTCLMKSLLSQKALQSQWQLAKQTFGQEWSPRWRNNAEDPVLKDLIHQLETGFWLGCDINYDNDARKSIVEAALNATEPSVRPIQEGAQDDAIGIKRVRENSPPSGLRRVKSFLCPQRSRSATGQKTSERPDVSSSSVGATYGNDTHLVPY